MSKCRTKAAPREARSGSEKQGPARQQGLAEVLFSSKRALRELVLSSGLDVFARMLEEDRTALCGPRNKPQADRQAYRHGHDEGQVVLGGRKIRVRKPGG